MPDFTITDVQDAHINPIGIVRVDEQFTHDHPSILSREEWIDANADMIEMMGAKPWLTRFLYILACPDVPYGFEAQVAKDNRDVARGLEASARVFGKWIGGELTETLSDLPKHDRPAAFLKRKEEILNQITELSNGEKPQEKAISVLFASVFGPERGRAITQDGWDAAFGMPTPAKWFVQFAAQDNMTVEHLVATLRRHMSRKTF